MSKFHLGWFMGPGVTVQGWNTPGYAQGYDFTKPDIFQDAARAMERACFDLFILEDSSAIPYTYKGNMDFALTHAAGTPKFDPVVLTPLLAAVTKHIGIAPTLTTTFYPPWLLARTLATQDHYSGGRIGFNIVTATSDAAAQNYGYDKQFEHDLRYDMADEYLDLVGQLWDAWEPDAVVMDEDTGVFVDPKKVKAVHFEGKFYKCRGPLNVPRSPQGRPVYVAPGGSPRGRRFSGRNAEVVLAGGPSIPEMKDYRDEVHRHAVAYGRDPANVKVMFTCMPTVVRDAHEAANHKEMATKAAAKRFEHNLAGMSFLSGIDFSKFDLDEPVGEIKTNGMQTMLRNFARHGPQATLRQILSANVDNWGQLVGTPDHIAGEMNEAIEEIGGDGFLIAGHVKPKYVNSIVDELVPVLQKRQLTRSEYGHEHFRDNLMAF
jgi:FMN-dependent oxidoreductase (nitrilotriacetate monooxygenase family)